MSNAGPGRDPGRLLFRARADRAIAALVVLAAAVLPAAGAVLLSGQAPLTRGGLTEAAARPASEGRVPTNLARASGLARIIIGADHAMFLEADGTLRTWTSNPSTANQVGDFGLGHTNTVPIDTPILVPGLTNVVKASAGRHCSFAVLADGTMLAWGARDSGQLGITRRDEIGVGLQPSKDASSPTRLSVPFAAADVSAGYGHVLALARDGTVFAWGDGSFGRLGIGDLPFVQIGTNKPREMREVLYPIRIPGLAGVTAVSAGREHSLALMGDGTVRAWGRNHRGQLGDGTTEDCISPVVVQGMRNAVAIGAGSSFSAALLADGTIMTWGDNTLGELGRKAPEASPVAAAVPGVSNVREIAVGGSHLLALTGAGTVVSWGADQVGATGRNRVRSAVPTVIPNLAGVQAVYAKFRRSFAVLGNGSVRIWGTPVPLFGRLSGQPDISPTPIELLLNPQAR